MNVARILRVISKRGTPVLCALLQPSWELISLFDKLIILSEGTREREREREREEREEREERREKQRRTKRSKKKRGEQERRSSHFC
jgi:hypothetical protein